ncbi:MAG: SIMPL domain-containing protein [Acidobacteriota bacterium]
MSRSITRRWVWVVTFFAISSIASVASAQFWGQKAEEDHISVSGEASVHVVPDKILVVLGFDKSDTDIMVARRKTVAARDAVVEALGEEGVPENKIQLESISVRRQYLSNSRSGEPRVYDSKTTLIVTLSSELELESVVSAALTAGAAAVYGVHFQTTEFKKYREQARDAALVAAKEKAQKMAAVLGQDIGAPISIYEDYTGRSWFYSSWTRSSGRDLGMSQASSQAPSPSGDESVDLGRITIRAGVRVTFRLVE